MADYLKKYEELNETVKKLLSPEGCPWDREQTHDSLKNYLIEEAYEFVEAVEENDPDKMEEELGDLLFHIVIHSVMAEQNNSFDLKSVTERITQKMIRRHPHVFGESSVSSVDEVWQNWDQIKRKEKVQETNLLSSVPKQLPALLRAEKIQKRTARVGFDWERTEDVWLKVEEEIGELKEAVAKANKKDIKEELGDLLFSVVNLSRKLDVDPEEALQDANKKFINRFNFVEAQIKAQNKDFSDVSLAQMDKFWNDAKARPK